MQWVKESHSSVRDAMLDVENQFFHARPGIDRLGSTVQVQLLRGGDLAAHRHRFSMTNEMCLCCKAIRVC